MCERKNKSFYTQLKSSFLIDYASDVKSILFLILAELHFILHVIFHNSCGHVQRIVNVLSVPEK